MAKRRLTENQWDNLLALVQYHLEELRPHVEAADALLDSKNEKVHQEKLRLHQLLASWTDIRVALEEWREKDR